MSMRVCLILFLFIGFSSFGQSTEYKKMLNEYYDGFPTISVEDAKQKIGKDVIFLDTREAKEFSIGHIQGAQCVGYDDFSMSTVNGIPKDAEIIVYCSIGARSQNIGKKLKKAGYTNVKNLYGGLFHWSNLDYPMVNKWGKSTTNIHGYSPEWGKWIKKGNVVY